MNREYLMTIKIKIDAFDDIDFRQKAKEILNDFSRLDNVDVKLQEVFKSKPPRKIKIL